MKYLFCLLLFAVVNNSFAQENNTVSWEIESKKDKKNEYSLNFNATVKEGWYVYSQYLESDDGPVRTEIVLEDNAAIKTDGKATEEGSKIEGFDKLFEMNITKFKKHLKITQKVKTTGPATIKGYITFMTCNDEMCLPPSDLPFEIQLK
jgi:hypothetical protein